jgi:16S rRNA (adenine1518-N6/adenine1519-N6)-dimethyltransferase
LNWHAADAVKSEHRERPATHRPRKRFGQHFLRDRTIIEAIVALIGPRPSDHLLEIGPGEGVLTAPLLASGAKIDAVELDRDLVRHLQKRFGETPGFQLHSGDILDFDLAPLTGPGEALRVVGNLPYNISTPLLLRLLFDFSPLIRDMLFMLQQEVVARLAANPGSKDYGRLSVMAQALATVESLLVVPPEAFAPPPQVVSAVVRLVPHANPLSREVRLKLESIVKLAFSLRRKTLRHTLGKALDPDVMVHCGVGLQQRAEEVPVEAFVRMAELSSGQIFEA